MKSQGNADGVLSRIPPEFSVDVGKLPADYVIHHGWLAMASARLEWVLGLLVSRLDEAVGGSSGEEVWPFKFEERLRWIERVFKRHEKLASLRELATEFISEATRLNAARNDIIHSAILGFDEAGRLYVARVKTDRTKKRLQLQEGSSWTMQDVSAVGVSLTRCERQGLELALALQDLCDD